MTDRGRVFIELNKDLPKLAHPDRGTSVDWCTYWWDSWDFKSPQKLPINGGKKIDNLTPFKHLAAAYPSAIGHRNEFVLLQSNINSPIKKNVSQEVIRQHVLTNDIKSIDDQHR
jgi:hypothetical protein